MTFIIKMLARIHRRRPPKAVDFTVHAHNASLGYLLRQIRRDSGLTQTELAALIHTQKPAISRLENHTRDLRLSTLGKVAAALGKELHIVFK